ncbi:MAG TPA: response regulator transcription factor [Verrucomicrobiae bacterium]|nr:response regulator transcription factor [Verrucomicrobiae bacterium]
MNGQTTKTRILIADDHPMVRDWLAQLVNRQADLAVCGEAADAAQTLQALETLHPDMAIVDLAMEGAHGTDLIKDITTRYEGLPVLVVSMHDEALYAERAIRAGARGYVTKREGAEKIRQAIFRVLKGEVCVSETVEARILKKASAGGPVPVGLPVDSLSDRELVVFELLGNGYGPSQIADELHLSVKTVEGYTARIKEKLLLKDARQLVQQAIQWNKLGGTGASAESSRQPPPLPSQTRKSRQRFGNR